MKTGSDEMCACMYARGKIKLILKDLLCTCQSILFTKEIINHTMTLQILLVLVEFILDDTILASVMQ